MNILNIVEKACSYIFVFSSIYSSSSSVFSSSIMQFIAIANDPWLDITQWVFPAAVTIIKKKQKNRKIKFGKKQNKNGKRHNVLFSGFFFLFCRLVLFLLVISKHTQKKENKQKASKNKTTNIKPLHRNQEEVGKKKSFLGTLTTKIFMGTYIQSKFFYHLIFVGGGHVPFK